MPRKIKCWCRYLPRPGFASEVACELLSDGTILPPAQWELLDQVPEDVVRQRQLVKGKHRDIAGQQMLPGIVD